MQLPDMAELAFAAIGSFTGMILPSILRYIKSKLQPPKNTLSINFPAFFWKSVDSLKLPFAVTIAAILLAFFGLALLKSDPNATINWPQAFIVGVASESLFYKFLKSYEES